MHAFSLGNVIVHPLENRLATPAGDVHVEPKVMGVLEVLAEQPQQVVSRDELLERVWTGTVVGEEALTRCISELRSALGDRAARPTFVQTVPKRGYRLLIVPKAIASPAVPVHAAIKTGGPLAPGKAVVSAAAAVLLCLAGALGWWLRSGPENSPRSIAVLPFQSSPGTSHAGAGDYFGEGLAEALQNDLVGLPELRVASRSASLEETRQLQPHEAGRQLGVDATLTGSLNWSDDRVRVSVQLIEVDSGYRLWSRTFEGGEDDLFAIQDAVVAAVAETLELPLAEPPRVTRITSNIDALDLYLLGRHHWRQRTREGMERAIRFFREAIETDPELAEAHAGLADAYLLSSDYGGRPMAEALTLAQPALRRALALRPTLSEAHASLGMWHYLRDEIPEAERALGEAVRLDPNSAMARMWRGNTLSRLGRINEAHQAYATAHRLDPRHPVVVLNYARSLMAVGDYEMAEAVITGAPEPDHPALIKRSATLAMERGDWSRALALADRLVEEDRKAGLHLQWRIHRHRDAPDVALTYLNELVRAYPEDEDVYLHQLEHYALTGNRAGLEQAVQRWSAMAHPAAPVQAMEQAWLGIEAARSGRYGEAVPVLVAYLEEERVNLKPDETLFRLTVASHLLTALAGLGRGDEFEHWKRQGLEWSRATAAQGWGSYQYRLQQAYVLAASGRTDAAMEAFRAAAGLGRLPLETLTNDPRLAELSASGRLAELS